MMRDKLIPDLWWVDCACFGGGRRGILGDMAEGLVFRLDWAGLGDGRGARQSGGMLRGFTLMELPVDGGAAFQDTSNGVVDFPMM